MVDSSQPSELGMLRPISMRAKRQRRISPQAGRALEILGHAIEYLTDEIVDVPSPLLKGHIDAIQLLMATNRQIYFECPEVPKLLDRILAIRYLVAVWATK